MAEIKKIKFQFIQPASCSCGLAELSVGVQDSEIDDKPIQTHCIVCGEKYKKKNHKIKRKLDAKTGKKIPDDEVIQIDE